MTRNNRITLTFETDNPRVADVLVALNTLVQLAYNPNDTEPFILPATAFRLVEFGHELKGLIGPLCHALTPMHDLEGAAQMCLQWQELINAVADTAGISRPYEEDETIGVDLTAEAAAVVAMVLGASEIKH